jgi:di/tricarboxylate transporter
MTPEAIFTLALAGAALILFVTEWVPADLVAILVMVALGLAGVLKLSDLFSGFGSPVVLTLVGIFMLMAALQHTGVTAYAAQILLRWTHGMTTQWVVGALAASAAVMSLMLNTVASAALVAPIGRHIAMKRDISPSRVLMPIAFGALLGGMATLLTTSNLLVSGMLTDRGMQDFTLFSFLPVGGPIALVGLAYLTFFSKWLLPERSPADQWGGLKRAREELTRTYRLRRRLHEAYVRTNSPLVGFTLAESGLGHRYGVTISAVVRGRRTFAPPGPNMRLRAGDWLLLQGRPEETEEAATNLRLDLIAPDEETQALLYRTGSELAEVALSPRSTAVGSTLADIKFRERFGINVLGVWHEGRPIRSHLSEHPLSKGDALLVQGDPEKLLYLQRDPDFLVLTHLPEAPEHTEKAVATLAILGMFLAAIAFDLVPVSLAALLAGAAAVVVGAETIEQARRSIRWQVLFLIGGMLPLATALEQTGAASFMIGQLDGFVSSLGPRGLMMLFFAITALLAQFTSGQAATLIVAPLALSSALKFGISARTLMMAVAIGASTGFLSPVSHAANLLVMGPGGYKFGDYAKLGFPLMIVATLGVALLTPIFYPF